MEYKRVLTVQDLSCLGQCSGSVALTTLAAFGYEACLLPTALLSAHTAFRGPYVCQLRDSIGPIAGHWKREGIRFDAILTGYLGAAEEVTRDISSAITPMRPAYFSPGFRSRSWWARTRILA